MTYMSLVYIQVYHIHVHTFMYTTVRGKLHVLHVYVRVHLYYIMCTCSVHFCIMYWYLYSTCVAHTLGGVS
jgi:hypothetical protein